MGSLSPMSHTTPPQGRGRQWKLRVGEHGDSSSSSSKRAKEGATLVPEVWRLQFNLLGAASWTTVLQQAAYIQLNPASKTNILQEIQGAKQCLEQKLCL